MDEYQFCIRSGCVDCSKSLGFVKMPLGYALMLNSDGSHFFWIEVATNRMGVEHWNKWAVYYSAKYDKDTHVRAPITEDA